jgi:hypothetical protein
MPRGIYERPEGSGFGGFSTMSAASDAGKELAVNPTPSSLSVEESRLPSQGANCQNLTNTKNGSARTVHLNADSIAALGSIHLKGQKKPSRDSGTRWAQDNHYVCPLQPPVP